MPKDFNNWPLAVSRKIYGRLLLAYPKTHREEYSSAMAQLFHDQCRDAWNEARGLGVMKLWLRVLPDLVKTSIIERFAALTERKSMSDKIAALIQPRTIFFRVFVVVFLIILCGTVAVTFILPESYASTVQIKVEQEDHVDPSAYDPHFLQTTFEIIQSQLILEPVIDKLNLNVVWGKKYGMGTFKTSETVGFLTNMMALSPVRNTSLVDITVYSGDKKEAAQIANAIAESFRDYLVKAHGELTEKGAVRQEYKNLEITTTAQPGREPVRPNKPLNITLGAIVGIFLALVVGGIAALTAFLIGKRTRKIPATT